MATWYVMRGKQIHGPYAEEQVRQWIRSGQVQGTDRLARAGASEWLLARDLLEFASDLSATTGPSATPPPLPLAPAPVEVATAPPPARPQPSLDPKKWSGLAVAGLVCGILNLFPCPFVCGAAGIVLSLMAINQGDRDHGKIGLWTSISTTAFWVLYVIAGMSYGFWSASQTP